VPVAPNPKVAGRIRRAARVGRYEVPEKADVRDAFRLTRNLARAKDYINTDFRSGTLGSLAFDILDHERVQQTQWGRTLKRFLDSGLDPA